jgi:hypothetical protein
MLHHMAVGFLFDAFSLARKPLSGTVRRCLLQMTICNYGSQLSVVACFAWSYCPGAMHAASFVCVRLLVGGSLHTMLLSWYSCEGAASCFTTLAAPLLCLLYAFAPNFTNPSNSSVNCDGAGCL